jgi:cell division protein FtsB
MICNSCKSEIQQGQLYCPHCGLKVEPVSVEDLERRLRLAEERIETTLQSRGQEQRFLELDTAARVVTTVRRWTSLFVFFVGVPVAILLIIGSVIVGRKLSNLNDVVEVGRKAVDTTLQKAEDVSARAQKTATDALDTSNAVRRNVDQTSQQIAAVRKNVDQLAGEVDKSRANVTKLNGDVAGQTVKVNTLQQQFAVVEVNKNLASLRDTYPAFGERVAGWKNGWIDPTKKPAGSIYIALVIVTRATSLQHQLSAEKIAQAESTLEGHKYIVFEGGVSLQATSGRSSQGVVGLDDGACSMMMPPHRPPCLVYFRTSLKDTAQMVRAIVRDAQVIPDNAIQYIDPKTLSPNMQDLLVKSAVDVAVVLTDDIQPKQ